MVNYFIILIIAVVFLVLLYFLVLRRFIKHANTGTFNTSVTQADLKQPADFYSRHANGTANYLKGLYPMAASTIDSFTPQELAVIYNSLTIYYNCCFSMQKNDLFGKNIPILDPECCQKYPLPYIPQGLFYDVISFKRGQSIVESDSIAMDGAPRDVKDCISNTPQIPWAQTCGEGPPQPNGSPLFGTDQDLSFFIPWCSGPGPFWILGYSLIRAIYYPHGPQNTKLANGTYNPLGWTCKPKQIESDYVFKQNSGNWWEGIKENNYIEVTHSDTAPGMGQSQGYWMNGFPCGGTGLFYKISKTKIAKNKLDMLFNLLIELKNASSLDLPDLTKTYDWVPTSHKVNYSGMSGSDLLKHFYNTDDPYIICWKYIAGNNNTTDSGNSVIYKNGVPDTTNAETNKIWNPTAITSTSTPTNPAYLVKPSKWYWFDNATGALGMSGLMNPFGKGNTWLKMSCKKTGPEFDPANIGNSYPFGTNQSVGYLDATRKYFGLDKNAFPTWDQVKKAIDVGRNSQDYYLSRVGCIVSLDEPILWASRVLGYVSLQQPQSANSNGYFQWEIIHTEVPDKTWLDNVKGRIYPFMQGTDDDFSVTYTIDGHARWAEVMSRTITIRDPFDVNNDSKSKPVQLGGIKIGTSDTNTCGSTYTFMENNVPMCTYGGNWGCCPDALPKRFPGNEPKGLFNPTNQTCYPFWKNIYSPDNLTKHYGQLEIFTGQNIACLDYADYDKSDVLFCGTNPTCTSDKPKDVGNIKDRLNEHLVNNHRQVYGHRSNS